MKIKKIILIFGLIINSFCYSMANNSNELIAAVYNNNNLAVLNLILDGADVNQKDNNGWTPLMHAVKINNKDIVELLLDNYVYVNDKSNEANTALIIASDLGNPEIVQILLDYGADINIKTDKGWTPLLTALRKGDKNIVEMLINKLKMFYSEDQLKAYIDTKVGNFNALNMAIALGHKDICELLIKNGATFDVSTVAINYALMDKLKKDYLKIFEKIDVSNDESGLLFYFIKYFKTQEVEILLKLIKDLFAPEVIKYYIEIKSKTDETALILAAQCNDKHIVDKILDMGAAVDQENDNGKTALFYAARKGNKEIFDLLIQNGANINKKDKDNYNYLILSAMINSEEAIKLFLEGGINIDEPNKYNETALVYALQYGNNNDDIIKMFFKHGAKFEHLGYEINNALTNKLQDYIKLDKSLQKKEIKYNGLIYADDAGTLLSKAVTNNNKEVVERILEILNYWGGEKLKKFFINYKHKLEKNSKYVFNGVGDTPLMVAITTSQKNKEIIELLIKNGANINQSGFADNTPLMASAIYGEKDIAELLLKNGANINEKGYFGKSALIRTITRNNNFNSGSNHKEVIELLLRHGASVTKEKINNKGLVAYAKNPEIKEILKQAKKKQIEISKYKKELFDLINSFKEEKKSIRKSIDQQRLINTEKIYELITKIRKANISLDLRDIDGNTPLHLAAIIQNQDIFYMILRACPILITIKKNADQTPIDLNPGFVSMLALGKYEYVDKVNKNNSAYAKSFPLRQDYDGHVGGPWGKRKRDDEDLDKNKKSKED